MFCLSPEAVRLQEESLAMLLPMEVGSRSAHSAPDGLSKMVFLRRNSEPSPNLNRPLPASVASLSLIVTYSKESEPLVDTPPPLVAEVLPEMVEFTIEPLMQIRHRPDYQRNCRTRCCSRGSA
jgi:hypothetical protein